MSGQSSGVRVRIGIGIGLVCACARAVRAARQPHLQQQRLEQQQTRRCERRVAHCLSQVHKEKALQRKK